MSKSYPYSDFFGAWAKIYTLSDSEGNVFYVGCTTQSLSGRLARHISNSKNKYTNSRKAQHIRSLNYNVKMNVVDMKWVTYSKSYYLASFARSLEKKWIQHFSDLGCGLTNRDVVKKFQLS